MRSRHNKIKLLSCLEIDSYMALKPGEGENAAVRSELFSPPPGFKAVRGRYFKRIRKQHVTPFGPQSEGKEKS